jgi:hypothetical protein
MSRRNLLLLLVGLAIALGVALLSPLASSDPDGLERVAEDRGFLDRAQDAPYRLLPDYTFPGVEDERASTIASGVVGVLAVLALTVATGWLLRRRRLARERRAGALSPPPTSRA